MVMGGAALMTRVITVAASILLARVLEPRDFGLVALAMLVYSTISLFSGLGMDSALIHSKVDKSRIAFPAFLVTFLIAVLLFLFVFFNSTPIAGLLGDPAVEPVVRVLSALILLDTLSLIPTALLSKDLRFGAVSRSMLIGQLVDTMLSLALAFGGFGLWSLVFGRLAGSLSRIVVVWLAYPGWIWLIPRRWQGQDLKGLLSFGFRNTGAGIVSFFNHNWDDWLVGRVLGSTALGFYSKAYSFTTKTVEDLSVRVILAVFFPTYAQIQDDKARLSSLYVRSLGIVTLAVVPMAMGMFIIAPELVPLLLTEKWNPMVPALQVFALKTLVRPLSGSAASVWLGIGRPDLNLRAGLVVTVVMVPLALLLLGQGFVGVAIAVAVSHVAGLGYHVLLLHRMLPGVVPEMTKAILPAMVAGCVMMAGVQLAKTPLLRFAGGQHNLLSVGAMIGFGAVLYILVAVLLQRTLILEAIELVLSVLRGRLRMAQHRG